METAISALIWAGSPTVLRYLRFQVDRNAVSSLLRLHGKVLRPRYAASWGSVQVLACSHLSPTIPSIGLRTCAIFFCSPCNRASFKSFWLGLDSFDSWRRRWTRMITEIKGRMPLSYRRDASILFHDSLEQVMPPAYREVLCSDKDLFFLESINFQPNLISEYPLFCISYVA